MTRPEVERRATGGFPEEKTRQADLGRVFLWRAETGFEGPAGADAQGIMSDAEKAKCGRYLREKDRASCVSSRVLSRLALSGLCGTSPGGLVFSEGAHGKPVLLEPDGNPGSLRFNLSHCGEMIVLAASCDTETGVDVEKIAPRADMLMIARRFFSPDEALMLSSLAGAARLERFLALWTLKEAAMKALGGGIFLGLSGIRFSFPRDGVISSSIAEGFPAQARDLSYALFEPMPGFIAAVAAFGEFCIVSAREAPGWRETGIRILAASKGFQPLK